MLLRPVHAWMRPAKERPPCLGSADAFILATRVAIDWPPALSPRLCNEAGQGVTAPFRCAPEADLSGLSGDRLRAPGEHPARPHEVAGVAVGIALEIILVLGLGFPEVARRRRLRSPPCPATGRTHRRRRWCPRRSASARRWCRRSPSDSLRRRSLPWRFARGRIVDLEEELQQRAVADLRGIEDDLDRLGMGAVVAIGRVRHVAAGIADAGRDDARRSCGSGPACPRSSRRPGRRVPSLMPRPPPGRDRRHSPRASMSSRGTKRSEAELMQ